MATMVGLKQLIRRRFSLRDSIAATLPTTQHEKLRHSLPSHHLARLTPKRFLDLHQLGNRAAIEKERARLTDEMNRGYFADMAEFKQHGGKIAEANKVIIPAMEAVKFPDFEVCYSDGKTMKLPFRLCDHVAGSDKSSVPKATLVCLSFRASSQEMINSWSMPYAEAFSESKDVHLYQDICSNGSRIAKPNHHESNDTLQRQTVYSFGDHYYFRKELKILNLLTGYIFLLDNFGRVRWKGSGLATEDELSSLFSSTSLLLDE